MLDERNGWMTEGKQRPTAQRATNLLAGRRQMLIQVSDRLEQWCETERHFNDAERKAS